MASVADAKSFKLRCLSDERGSLSVLEFADVVPFRVARLFYVGGVPANTKRGAHAHRACHQFFICQAGRILVELYDGVARSAIEMGPGDALSVPPGLFAGETFRDPTAALLVLCDRPYEAGDYIHTLEEFEIFRRQG
jgi:dTDP-4-dehydrorhamnose 3,5-epimerase-like enzyme